MKMVKFIQTFIIFALLIIFSSITFADIPTTISYQGALSDAIGDPVADGMYSLTFTIYDDAFSGSILWVETQPTVQVTNGLFAVSLGAVVPIDPVLFSLPDRWLGISVNSDPEISPRTKFQSGSYAFHSQTVAQDAITTTEVLDSSLLVSDLANEMGVAGGISTGFGFSLTTSSPPSILVSETITCPSDGYVLAIASVRTTVVDDNTGGDGYGAFEIAYNLKRFSGTVRTGYIEIDFGLTNIDYFTESTTLHSVNPVTAGEHAFTLEGKLSWNEGGWIVTAREPVLTLIFIPTSYE